MSSFCHQIFLKLSYKNGLITLTSITVKTTTKENTMVYATLDLETETVYFEEGDDAFEM